MSLGLPSHLARIAMGRAFDKALHAVACATLLCAALTVLAFSAVKPQLILWPALLAVVFMGVALWLNDRFDSRLFAITYLAVGAAGVYWYSVTLLTQLEQIVAADAIWLALPKIAVVMVAGAGVGAGSALAWCVIGYVIAELASIVVAVQLGMAFELDIPTLVAFLIAVSTIGLSVIATYRARKAQPRLHRAARDERRAALRSGMEVKAAALLHDTVLSHLAAIANTPDTELSPDLSAQISRDLEILVGQEWLNEPKQAAATALSADWMKSAFMTAILEARMLGLEVVGTGDMAAVARLDKSRSTALGLAAKQCLTNVIKHSGTMRAEVAVYGSDTEVSVMVVDSGKGFEPDGIDADRLGLRASVMRRIEAVGGTVQLWSTPGSGTSVLIQVPAMETVERSGVSG